MALTISVQKKILLAYTEELIGLSSSNGKTITRDTLYFLSTAVRNFIDEEKLDHFSHILSEEATEEAKPETIQSALNTAFSSDQNQVSDSTIDSDLTNSSWAEFLSDKGTKLKAAYSALTQNAPEHSITALEVCKSVFLNEMFHFFTFVGGNEITPIWDGVKCCFSSELLATIYSQWQCDELSETAIKLIRNIDHVIDNNKKFIKDNLSQSTEKRILYIVIKYIEMTLNFKNTDMNTEALVDFFQSSNNAPNNDENAGHLNLKDVLLQAFDSSDHSIITKQGHTKLSNYLISLFLGANRFTTCDNEENEAGIKLKKAHDNLVEEYKKNRAFIYNFLTNPNVNIIDFILQLLNSKGLSIFILESIISRLGNFDSTSDNSTEKKTFNQKLIEIGESVSNDILISDNKTAVDLWKNQLIKIFQAFEDRPGGMPKTAKAYIQAVKDDEVITSVDFIYKLTGFYCSLTDGKKEPLDEVYFWFITIHEASHSIIEIENELKLHNQILSNQVKAFIFALTSIIAIIAVCILLAYKSWLIFGLMLTSALMTAIFSYGWYYFIESGSHSPKNNFINSLNQKKALFSDLQLKMKEDAILFTSFAHEINQYIQDKLAMILEQSTNITINMPKVIASALMGLSYSIALSIPVWAYCLNVFQSSCFVPAILIAVIATICYHWANLPVAHETPKILDINTNMALKSSCLFNKENRKPLPGTNNNQPSKPRDNKLNEQPAKR